MYTQRQSARSRRANGGPVNRMPDAERRPPKFATPIFAVGPNRRWRAFDDEKIAVETPDRSFHHSTSVYHLRRMSDANCPIQVPVVYLGDELSESQNERDLRHWKPIPANVPVQRPVVNLQDVVPTPSVQPPIPKQRSNFGNQTENIPKRSVEFGVPVAEPKERPTFAANENNHHSIPSSSSGEQPHIAESSTQNNYREVSAYSLYSEEYSAKGLASSGSRLSGGGDMLEAARRLQMKLQKMSIQPGPSSLHIPVDVSAGIPTFSSSAYSHSLPTTVTYDFQTDVDLEFPQRSKSKERPSSAAAKELELLMNECVEWLRSLSKLRICVLEQRKKLATQRKDAMEVARLGDEMLGELKVFQTKRRDLKKRFRHREDRIGELREEMSTVKKHCQELVDQLRKEKPEGSRLSAESGNEKPEESALVAQVNALRSKLDNQPRSPRIRHASPIRESPPMKRTHFTVNTAPAPFVSLTNSPAYNRVRQTQTFYRFGEMNLQDSASQTTVRELVSEATSISVDHIVQAEAPMGSRFNPIEIGSPKTSSLPLAAATDSPNSIALASKGSRIPRRLSSGSTSSSTRRESLVSATNSPSMIPRRSIDLNKFALATDSMKKIGESSSVQIPPAASPVKSPPKTPPKAVTPPNDENRVPSSFGFAEKLADLPFVFESKSRPAVVDSPFDSGRLGNRPLFSAQSSTTNTDSVPRLDFSSLRATENTIASSTNAQQRDDLVGAANDDDIANDPTQSNRNTENDVSSISADPEATPKVSKFRPQLVHMASTPMGDDPNETLKAQQFDLNADWPDDPPSVEGSPQFSSLRSVHHIGELEEMPQFREEVDISDTRDDTSSVEGFHSSLVLSPNKSNRPSAANSAEPSPVKSFSKSGSAAKPTANEEPKPQSAETLEHSQKPDQRSPTEQSAFSSLGSASVADVAVSVAASSSASKPAESIPEEIAKSDGDSSLASECVTRSTVEDNSIGAELPPSGRAAISPFEEPNRSGSKSTSPTPMGSSATSAVTPVYSPTKAPLRVTGSTTSSRAFASRRERSPSLTSVSDIALTPTDKSLAEHSAEGAVSLNDLLSESTSPRKSIGQYQTVFPECAKGRLSVSLNASSRRSLDTTVVGDNSPSLLNMDWADIQNWNPETTANLELRAENTVRMIVRHHWPTISRYMAAKNITYMDFRAFNIRHQLCEEQSDFLAMFYDATLDAIKGVTDGVRYPQLTDQRTAKFKELHAANAPDVQLRRAFAWAVYGKIASGTDWLQDAGAVSYHPPSCERAAAERRRNYPVAAQNRRIADLVNNHRVAAAELGALANNNGDE